MTPLIPSILSTTSQAFTNSAVTDSPAGGTPFESILNGAIQANKTSNEMLAALPKPYQHTAPTVINNSSGLPMAAVDTQVLNNVPELIKELATKDASTNNYMSFINLELATKDQLISSSDSEKITNPVQVAGELTTQKNHSEFVDAQIMMASVMQQQMLQAQPQTANISFEDSAASAELPPGELKTRSAESMLTSKLDSLAIAEKMVDQKISSSLSGMSINTDQLQSHLALRSRPEMTEQLAQIQARLEAINHRYQDSAPSASVS